MKAFLKAYNLKIMDLNCFVIFASCREPLQVVYCVNLHGALLHFTVDAHAIVDIVHL